MSGDEKSTGPGLSIAERKALRVQEAQEAIADHEDAQKAFHENRERLREERLARETAAGRMLYPAPEIPDDTLIDNVRFSTRVRNALSAVGWKNVGQIREASDATLLSPAGSRKGVCRSSSGNAGIALHRWRSTKGQKADLICRIAKPSRAAFARRVGETVAPQLICF
jgi:hypothetical protein